MPAVASVFPFPLVQDAGVWLPMGRLRRFISQMPVVGAVCRRARYIIRKPWRIRPAVKTFPFVARNEGERILELQREVNELQAKLRAHKPLIADYGILRRRVVELEDQLLQVNGNLLN